MEVYKDYSKMVLKQELYKLLYRLSHIRTLSSHEYLQYNRNSISILKQRIKSIKRLLEKLENDN